MENRSRATPGSHAPRALSCMQNALIYPLFRTDKLTRWRDRLSSEVGLTADPVDQAVLEFYDSFDWRLYADGKYLEVAGTADSAELRLRRLADRKIQALMPVVLPVPRFPSALATGALREQLEALLDMRALLPLASLRIRRYTLRDEDGEGKTRARVHLEAISLVDADGKRRQLLKRLRLQPLRGYGKAAKRIAGRLEQDYRLQAAGDELFRQALGAAGKQPGDYSSKLDIRLQPDQRADAAVRQVLVTLFDAMQANEAGTIADLDSEFLHDFRVAVRRTRSALGELKHVFPPATLKRFRREFAWLGGLTGEVRDLDVYLLKFDDYRAAVPPGLRDGLEPLRGFLQFKQHEEQSQHLAVQLQGRRYRKLKQQWQTYLASPLPKRPTARDAGKPIGLVAHHRSWRMYRRVMKEGSAITPDSPPPELHELRKSCKKLRYLMEFFQSLYPSGEIRASIKELKQLQDNLGDFQDLDVQIASMRRFAMEMRRRGEYTAAAQQAMDALMKTLEQRMHQARGEFETRFGRFASEENRDHFRQLFHPEEEDRDS